MTIKSPFRRVPISIPGSANYALDLTKITSQFPVGYETDAAAHWLLGSDNPTMADVLSGQLLTAVATAPVQSRNYLSTVGGAANGLASPYDDSATQTVCAVFQRPNNVTGTVIFGSSTTTTAQGGSALIHETTPAWTAQTRNTGGTSTNGTPADPTEDSGSWLFAGISYSPSQRIAWIDNAAVLTTTVAKQASTVPKKVHLGNGSYANSAYYGAVSVAEFIVFSSAKTAQELADIAARSKARMAARGINMWNG